MDGWSYFPLGQADYKVYRDFFYPVTPVTYWQAQWASNFSEPLLALRLGVSLLPLAWSIVTYLTIRRVAGVVTSGVLTLFLAAILVNLRLESFVGWNTQFFLALSVGYSLTFLSLDEATRLQRRKLSLWLAGAAGLFYCFAVLLKQTVALTVLFSFIVFLGLVLGLGKFRARRLVLKGIFVSFFSAIASGIGFIVILRVEGILEQFIASMTSAGGKNPSIAKFVKWLESGLDAALISQDSLIFLSAILISALLLSRSRANFSNGNAALTQFIIFTLSGFMGLYFLMPDPRFSTLLQFVTAAAGALAASFVARLTKRNPVVVSSLVLALGIFVPLAFGLAISSNSAWLYLSNLPRFSIIATFFSVSFCLLVFLVTPLHSTLREGSRAFSAPNMWRTGTPLPLLFLSVSGLGSFVNVLSSGGPFYLQWFIPQVALFLAVVIRWMSKDTQLRPLAPLAILLVVLGTGSFLASVKVSPYNWFGWSEPSLTLNGRAAADYSYLRSTALSSSSKAFYDRVDNSLTDGATNYFPSRVMPEITLFAFPNIPAFYSLTELQPLKGLKCAIHWFDVCPNDFSHDDLETFKTMPADIIAWAEVPLDLVEGNESVFLNTRSAWRDWDAYRNEQVANNSWVLIDRIEADGTYPNTFPINIYANLNRHSN